MAFAIIVLAWQTNPVFAFYEQQNEGFYIDARGLVRGFVNASHYPDDSILYPEKNTSGFAAISRLMIDADLGEQWRFEINVYQTYIPRVLATPQSSASLPVSVERSAALETSFSDQAHVHLALDRFVWRGSKQNLDLSLGRQAINLATTFYFTPNDFFSPFSAQTFYRVYKLGVDALRAEISLGEFSQISFMSVLGYQIKTGTDTGWSDKPDSDRASHLLRWSSAFGHFETMFMVGRVVDKNVIGLALQGEVFEWLGIRLEGHHAKLLDSNVDDYQQLSFGLEHRWENSVELRLELFYNGLGSDDFGHEQVAAKQNNSPYLGRRYSALGGSYNITPLLTGQAVIITNINDYSHLISFNANYSLSDESELVINLTTSLGDSPRDGILKDEFGAYPTSINVEGRLFF